MIWKTWIIWFKRHILLVILIMGPLYSVSKNIGEDFVENDFDNIADNQIKSMLKRIWVYSSNNTHIEYFD